MNTEIYRYQYNLTLVSLKEYISNTNINSTEI